MKTFPAAFTAQKNLLTGASPVWIFKLTAGGVDYYLSENAFTITPWGVTTRKWVKGWGQLQEGISGTLDEFRISDFSLDVLADPDASPNMETIATTYPLEASPVSLYLWFYGCADPPQEMARGYVKDIDIPDETLVKLSFQDESLRLERAMIGTRVTLQAYPYADPDDVGKVIPIPFGAVNKLRALAVNAGVITTLPASMSALATSFTVTSAAGLAVGSIINVDDEQILVSALAGSTITSCTRGYNLTLAASHLKGASVWEQKTTFDYVFSDIPVTAVPKVYAELGGRRVDITAAATVYSGAIGDEHPSYPGKGVITLGGYVTASQSVDLLVNDGISINDALSVVDGILISDNLDLLNTISLSDTIAIASSLGLTDAIAIASTLGVTDTITVLSSIAPADSIAILNGLGISDGITISDTIAVSESAHNHDGATDMQRVDFNYYSVSASGISAPTKLYDGDTSVICSLSADGWVKLFCGVPRSGAAPLRVRGALNSTSTGDFDFRITINGVDGTTVKPTGTDVVSYTEWITIDAWSDIIRSFDSYLYIGYDGSGTATLYEAWWEVETDQVTATALASIGRTGGVTRAGATGLTGTVSRTGAVTLTGGVSRDGGVALNGTVGRTGSVTLNGTVGRTGAAALSGDVSLTGGASRTGNVTRSGGVTRSGAVTLSGNSVANTLIGDRILCDVVSPITAIADAFPWLLTAAGSAATFQQVGAWPASYAYNGAITEYRSALYWLNTLAFQSRAWFKLSLGTARLIYRPDTLTPVKAIAACRISGGKRVHSRKKTEYDEILNTIDVLYDRDWSQDAGASAYQSVASGSNASSITDYGPRERPKLFLLDFVTDPAMAADLLNFYLTWYATRHWLHTFDTFLYDAELEFADAVTLGFAGNVVGQALEAGAAPGNSTKSDTIGMVVVV